MAVSKVLAPEYVAFSQELPPGSKSIWEIVEGDLEHFAPSQIGEGDNRLAAVAEFLDRFFSCEVVDNVLKHIKALQGSTLGAEYTLGKPFPVLGRSVIDGLRELAASPATGTQQERQEQQEQRQEQQEQQQEQHQELGQGNLAFTPESSGNAGNGDDDGFQAWPAIGGRDRQKEVWLTRWSTPPRGTRGRGLTIRERSEEFLSIVGPRASLLYDPHYSSRGTVSLYHGTRAAQLASFAYEGIDPLPRVNEFWGGPAFYTCNSVQYAYEFPLHYHLGQGTDDHVAVMEFKIDAAVLNGEAAPFAGESKFRVKWFPSADERWESWVAYHMLPKERKRLKLRKEDAKSWDIIIGPVCFGGPSEDGKVAPVHLNTAGVHLIQVAFCSKRAQAWLQTKFCHVFMERRRG